MEAGRAGGVEMRLVTAIVLLQVERERVTTVAQKLAEAQAVSEVFAVAGQYDLVAVVRARSHEMLGELVTDMLLPLAGIRRSETLVAFKIYSRYDLDRIFDAAFERREDSPTS